MSESVEQQPAAAAPPQPAQPSQGEQIVNAPRIVNAFGKQYEIKQFTLGPAFRAAEYVGPFGYLFKTILKYPRNEKGYPIINEDEMIDLAVTAISISGPSALGLISVATSEPPEWLEDKNIFDGLDILVAVMEKNLDFFTPENIARLQKVFGGLQRAMLTIGGSTSTS